MSVMEGLNSGISSSSEGNWHAWHERHAARLLLYARQWLPERADAEDAVQAGFVKFWRHKPVIREEDTPLLYTACAAPRSISSNATPDASAAKEHVAAESEDVLVGCRHRRRARARPELRRALEQLPPISAR